VPLHPFVPAEHYTPAGRSAVDLVVLHSAESLERSGSAWRIATYFAGKAADPAPRASCHWVVDDAETIQCVREEDVGWHAPGANHNSIGIEHAGKASQDEAGWRDDFSAAMLLRSIELCAAICARWSIPAALVTVTGLASLARGITTHDAVSRAFGRSTHTDPGPAFPLVWYVERVRGLLA
jgi:N-acetyl-anhydromuramyl-L-alanine amidase AmpD